MQTLLRMKLTCLGRLAEVSEVKDKYIATGIRGIDYEDTED